VRRLEREARAVKAIKSPHVVSIVEFGRDGAKPYLAMELLSGRDLGAVLADHHRLSTARTVRIVRQMLRGLAAAHAAGILHRDLKPENVFLVDEGTERERVKLVDFGMSKLVDTGGQVASMKLTARGTIIGTPEYVAPEQARAESGLDARADVFAVGAVFFECLAGRPPHVGKTAEQVLISICTTDAPDVRRFAPDVPEAIARVVARSLARVRSQRYPSADGMNAALRAVEGDPRATIRIAIMGVIAALVGALLTLWFLSR
jgi:serine/threonine-protein kinase